MRTPELGTSVVIVRWHRVDVRGLSGDDLSSKNKVAIPVLGTSVGIGSFSGETMRGEHWSEERT